MDDLPRAERIVAEAQSNVVRQREIVARLERQGLDAKAAQDLLARFEEHSAARKIGLHAYSGASLRDEFFSIFCHTMAALTFPDYCQGNTS